MKGIVFICFDFKTLFCGLQGSDITMLNKMNQTHNENKIYSTSKSEYDTYFGINHFAGVVYYDSRGTQTHLNRFK